VEYFTALWALLPRVLHATESDLPPLIAARVKLESGIIASGTGGCN
jgi:hypothetical protein